MIEAVFFDNDGILVDTEPIWVQSNLEAFHALGFEVTRDWYLDYNMTQGKGLVHFLPAHGFSPTEIKTICDKRTARYWELLPDLSPMPGVEMVLQALKQKGIKLVLVTAALKLDFAKVHENLDLISYFDFVIVNEDTPNTKPAPDPYLLALEKANVRPENVLVVEDSPRGLKSARAAGIEKIIAIPTEITIDGDFSQAWRVEKNIEKVLEVISISY